MLEKYKYFLIFEILHSLIFVFDWLASLDNDQSFKLKREIISFGILFHAVMLIIASLMCVLSVYVISSMIRIIHHLQNIKRRINITWWTIEWRNVEFLLHHIKFFKHVLLIINTGLLSWACPDFVELYPQQLSIYF